MNEIIILAVCILAFGLGFLLAYWIKGKIISQKSMAAEAEAKRMLDDAKRRAETLQKEAFSYHILAMTEDMPFHY